MRARRRLRWTLVALASLGVVVGGLVLSTNALLSGKSPALSGSSSSRSSPPTTVNPRIVDRQPAVGQESPLLPTSGTSSSTSSGTSSSSGPTIIIPAIGVRASIVAEGIDQTPGDVGNLAVPSLANAVGWWDGGPAPGQGGVAVITGHRVQNWAFWRLPDVQIGDAVQVIGTNGQTTNWTVTSMQQMLKADLPSSIWTEGGSPELALVTCGGTFNYSTGHYNDNIVLWAKPA